MQNLWIQWAECTSEISPGIVKTMYFPLGRFSLHQHKDLQLRKDGAEFMALGSPRARSGPRMQTAQQESSWTEHLEMEN